MALVTKGYYCRITLVDNGNNRTIKTYDLRATDMAAATTAVTALRAALLGVTDSVISAYNIAERFYENALAFPASGIENENKASISVIVTDSESANLKIPAPKPAIFTGTSGGAGNIVDVTNAALITYTDVFRSAGECYISDGDDLLLVSSGKRISAKSSNG